jgi:hypothetical protein
VLQPTAPALTLALLLGGFAPAQSLDQILSRHFQALGGEQRLHAIKTLRMEGKVNAGEPWELPFTRFLKRPGRVRDEVRISGTVMVQGYDGSNAWQLNPLTGKKDPEILGEESRRDQAFQADLEGPLLDWKAKGHRVELLGQEEVEGTLTWKLKVTLRSGDLLQVYLDCDSLMIIKEELKQVVRGTERETETFLGDYLQAGGIYFPGTVESGAKGAATRSKTLFEKIQADPVLDDALFEIPKAAPAARPQEKSRP